jgi:predicted aspartyl protease
MKRLFGSLLFLAALSVPALADECSLKLIASVDMTALPGGRYMVPVSINGMPNNMLLNTAGGITSLRRDSAEAMGLHPIDDSRVRLLSSNGNASQSLVEMDFRLGAIQMPRLQVIVMPNAGTGTQPFVGNLAGDVLGLYDVEMDFAGRKLNFFSKDHCPGKVIYWKNDAFAIVLITLQLPTGDSSRTGYRLYSPRGSHIHVPVTINGKELKAALNTGSPISTMSTDTAKYMFDVTTQSQGATPIQDPNAPPGSFLYTFPSLTFDTVTVTNARFLVTPNLTGTKDPNNSFRTDTRIFRIDDGIGGNTTIGLDVLRKLHLYVAYGESKLYITPASAPAP